MKISDAQKISEIQQLFSSKFQNLKLEFYSQEHGTHQGSPMAQQLDSSMRLEQIRTIHKKGDISINGHLKVSTLEQIFKDHFGLNVQVFRKSGGIWLQTTSTDDWTLSEQNARGELSN